MNDITGLSYQPTLACRSNDCPRAVDFIEAGAGPLVALVHSSMAGARQWSCLMHDLQDHSQVRAINLFGYGGTPAWTGVNPPSLADFADLVAQAVADTAENISLVGHSFGGAVAMQAAAHQLKGRVKNLVLIEPSLFYLLEVCGHREAFDEISALAEYTNQCILDERIEAAAVGFIDYWCGPGTWATNSPGRQSAFARSISLLTHEWDAVLGGQLTPADWVALLPQRTLLLASDKTTRPSREIVELLLHHRPEWEFASIRDAGHMAPLTHPQLVNPLISGFLAGAAPLTGSGGRILLVDDESGGEDERHAAVVVPIEAL
jgi:pimeloyl-ACP methyl ester carboxylesterase